MFQNFSYLTLVVTDINISLDFYQNVFLWKPTSNSNSNVTFFPMNNGIILALYPIYEFSKDFPVSNSKGNLIISNNLHSIKEVDDCFNRFSQMNVKIVKMPKETNWGGYAGFILDPDEYLWEIVFNPKYKMNEKI